MISESTKRSINKIKDLSKRQRYTFITKNCDMYMIKENGNKHWLCKNKILTEWSTSEASDNFESWTFPDKESAREHFNDRSFDKDW